jgi:hypothetical protein
MGLGRVLSFPQGPEAHWLAPAGCSPGPLAAPFSFVRENGTEQNRAQNGLPPWSPTAQLRLSRAAAWASDPAPAALPIPEAPISIAAAVSLFGHVPPGRHTPPPSPAQPSPLINWPSNGPQHSQHPERPPNRSLNLRFPQHLGRSSRPCMR